MKVSNLFLATGMSLLGSIQTCGAMASPLPRPTVTVIETYGSGCSTPGSVVGTLAPGIGNDQLAALNYDMIFTQMSAFTTPPAMTESNADCHVALEVTPPYGYRFAITGLLAQGSYDAPQSETEAALLGGYHTSSRYEDQNGFVHQGVEGHQAPESFESPDMGFNVILNKMWDHGDHGDYIVERAIGIGAERGNFDVFLRPARLSESPCNATVYVIGDMSVSASSYGENAAESNLQRTVTNGRSHLGWAWQLRRCDGNVPPPPPNGECTSVLGAEWLGQWHTAYSAPTPAGGGIANIAAELNVGHDGTGYYRTTTFTGRLSDMVQCGSQLRGRWLVGSDFGDFTFNVSADERSFQGTYTRERGGFAGNTRIGAGVWEGRR